MKRIGVTGRSSKPTWDQCDRLYDLLVEQGSFELHHGDCVGADEMAHAQADRLGMGRVVHPPTDPKRRAFCRGGEVLEAAPYLVRNRAIVDATELLIALPAGPEESFPRAGEWATVRYARKLQRNIVIIWPDGSLTREGKLR